MAKSSKSKKNAESRELLEALTILEKEKNISKDTLLEAIENSLLTACKLPSTRRLVSFMYTLRKQSYRKWQIR